MSEPDILPEEPSEEHFLIGQKATDHLGKLVDGNGLKAEQVRLGKHETLVHQLAGYVRIALKPDVVKGQFKGKRAYGQVLGSESEVMAQAEGLAQGFIADKDVQIEMLQLLDKEPGRGWGIEPCIHTLSVTRKEFSVVDQCTKCNGQTFYNCTRCMATGFEPCLPCGGMGTIQCPACFGQMQKQMPDGSRGPCNQCAATGRVPCNSCRGHKSIQCTLCLGDGRIGCTECDQSGYWTHTFEMSFHAELEFDIDRQQIPPDVLQIVERLGVKELATEGHAEIFRLIQNPEPKFLIVPYIAFLPLANVEFTIEGKHYPSGIAGLTGRIMGIDPVLDPVIKPGINALAKLSKGPLATESLITQACKYRVLRLVVSRLSHHTKRNVYQTVLRQYPLVISDKYIKAAVSYAHIALLAISKGPRFKGMLVGTVLAAVISAGYFLGPVHAMVSAAIVQAGKPMPFALGADLAVFMVSYLAAWITIKVFAANALKKILPEEVQEKDKGLPAAGEQGWYALLTTLTIWAACAFFATQKPAWIVSILGLLGR